MEKFHDKYQGSFSYSYNYYLKLFVDLLMIFIPSIGYFLQALKFKKTKSTKGFAKFLCFLLIIANILRCIFWLGKRFNLTLLFQAIVVIISQIYLIHVYFQYQEELPFKIDNKPICEYLLNWKETLNPYYFWNWTDEIEYYKFIFIFIIIMIIASISVGLNNLKFFDIIGTLSVSCETFIELPQIKENCITKNIKNLSGTMVFMWLIGDLFKTWYNFVFKSPIQMIFGGLIMNCEDIVLNTQVIIYDENNFLSKIIFKKRQRYVTLEDDKNISNTSNKIDFEGDKNNETNV